jgi:hypothetical protein
MQRYQGIVVLALLSVVSAFGQKPDFTGTWKQINQSGVVRIDKIEHRGPYLKVITETTSAPGSSTGMGFGSWVTYQYNIDGQEIADNNANGPQTWTTIEWQGSALVFLKIVKDGHQVTVTRETWTLSDNGSTLTRTTRVINAGMKINRLQLLLRETHLPGGFAPGRTRQPLFYPFAFDCASLKAPKGAPW